MIIHMATEQDMPAVFALRFEVFVEEQGVPPAIELDEEDAHAVHLLAEEQGTCVGCARVILGEREAHLGRLAVKKTHRGCGIGRELCRFALALCRKRGVERVWLHAQLHAAAFYEKLGFRPVGTTFFEAGIEHIQMEITDLPSGAFTEV